MIKSLRKKFLIPHETLNISLTRPTWLLTLLANWVAFTSFINIDTFDWNKTRLIRRQHGGTFVKQLFTWKTPLWYQMIQNYTRLRNDNFRLRDRQMKQNVWHNNLNPQDDKNLAAPLKKKKLWLWSSHYAAELRQVSKKETNRAKWSKKSDCSLSHGNYQVAQKKVETVYLVRKI